MNAKDLKLSMDQVMGWCHLASPGDNELNLSTINLMKAFQQNKNVPLLEQWLIEQWDILGALLLAVVLCLVSPWPVEM